MKSSDQGSGLPTPARNALSRSRVAAICGTAAAVVAAATPLIGGAGHGDYDHCSQFISELGQAGAPHAARVSLAGFLPTGVLTLLFCWLAPVSSGRHPARLRAGLLLFSAVGWAYVVTAFFPCDPGCPTTGSMSQNVHTAFGVLEYVGGGIGLLVIAGGWRGSAGRILSFTAAGIVLAAFIAMSLPQLAAARGLLQRLAETALFGWTVVFSSRLWRRNDVASH